MGSKILYIQLLLAVGTFALDPWRDLRSLEEFEILSTNLDSPAYRLKDNIVPTFYDIDLDVYLDESRFNGLVQIEINVLESNITEIVLHQKVVSVNSVSVIDSTETPIPLVPFNEFELDSYYEIIKIKLENSIDVGTYTIIISYNGQIYENPYERGFYKGHYYFGNEKRYYATTQLQPFYARKAFPNFDEPQFKARFALSITRDSNLSPSYSNMPIQTTTSVSTNRIRETFYPTPIISSYIIAFHVSDFVETNTTSSTSRPFKIISRPGVTTQHEYAAEVGVRITNEMDTYFGVNYYEQGQGSPMKNDHIALPDFPAGAMENWGMVNYREAYLLYDPQQTNVLDKAFVAIIVAHELAHKWFGNLVTCFWWSNLWLNESFASIFEYTLAHIADPSLQLEEQFIVDNVQSALLYDAGSSATPMNLSTVATNPSISGHFSTASYAKGASVLRTIEHFVGPLVFRNALRYYLRNNSHSLGTPVDMYNSFRGAVAEDSSFATTYPNIDIGTVFDSWIQNAGSPVLNVNVNTETGVVTLTQERFLLSGTPANSIWQIPLTWTDSSSLDFSSTKPKSVMTGSSTTITVTPGSWVIFNIGYSGHYRVNYDEQNWESIAEALRTNRLAIHKMNRAQIVNDVLVFLRSGDISWETAFNVLSFLKDETDYFVWVSAISQIDWLKRRIEHIPLALEEYETYILEQFSTVIDYLGFDESSVDDTATIQNRMQILNYACNLGHQACIDYSLEQWTQLRENTNYLVPVNARRYVYCNGLRYGSESDYEFLFARYNSSENTADMVVMLRALGCTRSTTSLTHYLEQSLYNDKIRLHDRANIITYAMAGNKENIKTVLSFVYNSYAQLAASYGGGERMNVALSALATYLTDFEDIVNFQEWLYSNQLNLDASSFDTGKSVVSTSVSNLQWGNNVAQEFYTTLRKRNTAAAITAPVFLLLVTFTLHLFR